MTETKFEDHAAAMQYLYCDLQSRIAKLERARYYDQKHNVVDVDNVVVVDNVDVVHVDDSMRRARRAVELACCYSARWIWVPSNYYSDHSLEQRADLLLVADKNDNNDNKNNSNDNSVVVVVPSTRTSKTAYLCKSLLMENKKWTCTESTQTTETTTDSNVGGGGGEQDSFCNPKFVLVVLQYEATLNVTKLHVALQRWQKQKQQQKQKPTTAWTKEQHDWRIASPEDNLIVTGYAFNSVTPFGLLLQEQQQQQRRQQQQQQPSNVVPIVLASAIVEQKLPYFFMGGGHEHLKLRMATSEFIKATDALVANVTDPRNVD